MHEKPIWPIFSVNRLNWQCCLAGNSKMVPRILISSIAMGADYSFELISIVHWVPQFIGHNKIFLGSVYDLYFSHLYIIQLFSAGTTMYKKMKIKQKINKLIPWNLVNLSHLYPFVHLISQWKERDQPKRTNYLASAS